VRAKGTESSVTNGAAGDAARRALCRAFHAQAERLYRLALRYHGRPDAAEDAVQETFVRALNAMHRFRRDADLATWLYRIAVNVCLDGLRADRGRARRPLGAASDVPGCPGSMKAVEERQIADRVRRAIDDLPPDQRLLVVLRDLEGLSYGDISRFTRLSIGTVSSRLNRARERLARDAGIEALRPRRT
jgi:RNA polymerase sigma-70 factor, ECF subfamily